MVVKVRRVFRFRCRLCKTGAFMFGVAGVLAVLSIFASVLWVLALFALVDAVWTCIPAISVEEVWVETEVKS